MSIVIMGIDPGTRVTGYGIILINDGTCLALDYGSICPPVDALLSDRYLILFNAVEELIKRHSPDVIAIEAQYVGKNPQSALKLGQARGMAMLAGKRKGLPIFEYSPTSVKKAVGSGKASKQQMKELVKLLLGLEILPEPSDAADALAIALCHANALRYQQLLNRET